ncbi:putative disease resistance RPP13-like protein 1 [Olea europaea var. sylvestris]|uniref:putative disease resistance RPP13-like protein 1 n=1 Tax=Olea europaea var. sylvestris TaxID=158386 RepID=UPI000C1D3B55|nr:putative disease resistance RPP13-like protein 1 [Olea europaea var. sylvestris]
MRIDKDNCGPLVIFDKLIKIKLMYCDNCKEIPVLGHLPLLKYLHITHLDNVTSIRSSFYGESDCSSTSNNDGQETRVSFPSLKNLAVRFMPKLKEWEEAQMSGTLLAHVPHLRGSRASLKKMEISFCSGLRELPYDLDCRELSNLPNEMLKYCTSLRTLFVEECHNITSLPEMSGMGSLQSLVVGGCKNITSFPKMSGMKSLERLSLTSCTSFPELRTECLNSLIQLSIGLGLSTRSASTSQFPKRFAYIFFWNGSLA